MCSSSFGGFFLLQNANTDEQWCVSLILMIRFIIRHHQLKSPVWTKNDRRNDTKLRKIRRKQIIIGAIVNSKWTGMNCNGWLIKGVILKRTHITCHIIIFTWNKTYIHLLELYIHWWKQPIKKTIWKIRKKKRKQPWRGCTQ